MQHRGRAFVLAASDDPARAQATRGDLGVLGLASSRKKTDVCGVLESKSRRALGGLRLAKLPAGSSDVQLDVVPLLTSPAGKMQDRRRAYVGRRSAPDAV